MRTRILLFFLCVGAALLLSGMAPHTEAGEAAKTSTIEITRGTRITADIENKPLQEALRMMAEKNLFEIQGAVPAGEPVTVRFSNATLDEALKKVLRGYNYVLVSQGASKKPSLMVIGQIQPGSRTTKGTPTPTPPHAAAPSNQVLVPGTYYVPPSLLTPPAAPSPAAASERKTPAQGSEARQAGDQQQGGPQAPKPAAPGTADQQQGQQQSQQPPPQQQQQGQQP
jgi:hypothetical protein